MRRYLGLMQLRRAATTNADIIYFVAGELNVLTAACDICQAATNIYNNQIIVLFKNYNLFFFYF